MWTRGWWERRFGDRCGCGSALSSVGGVLLALAFPPYDVTALAFVALVPLLWSWRGARSARRPATGSRSASRSIAVLMYWFAFFGVVALVLVPLVCVCSRP